LENRSKFNAIYKSVVEWLKVAELNTTTENNGIDFEIVDKQLQLHEVIVLHCSFVYCKFIAGRRHLFTR